MSVAHRFLRRAFRYDDTYPATGLATGSGHGELHDLCDTVDRLAMVAEAMWRVIEEETPLTEADLAARIEALRTAYEQT